MKLSKSLLSAIFIGATIGAAGCAPDSIAEPLPTVTPNPSNVVQPEEIVQPEIVEPEIVETSLPALRQQNLEDQCIGCGRG